MRPAHVLGLLVVLAEVAGRVEELLGQDRRAAARADPAQEVLPHGRQLPRAPRGVRERGLVASAGSTSMAFMLRRSRTIPSSTVEWPGSEWPPPRTARARPCSRAWRIAATTSGAAEHCAISAGRRSCMTFH